MRLSLGLFDSHFLLAVGLIMIIIVATLSSLYLASKRLKHQRSRLLLVTVANLTAAAAIMGLAFNLQINNTAAVTTYLITSGAQAEQVNDIDNAEVIYALNKPRISLDASLAQHSFVQLDSISQLFDLKPDIQNLQLIGSGLSKQQWQDLRLLLGDKLKTMNITFMPNQPVMGLVDIQWPKERVEGQFIQLNGRFIGNKAQPNAIYELSLIDPIGEVLQIERVKNQDSFNFNFAAKSVGQWIYQLQLKQTNRSSPVITEPVAVNVSSAPVVKVLIKQAAPTFETKQFSNWASGFNSKITVLTRISKNKDIRQNFNFTQQEMAELDNPLSKKSLDSFDLMLIDGRSLLALSENQTQALEAAVKSGLGLYIMLDQSLIDAWPSSALNTLSKLAIKPLNAASYAAIPQWQNSKIEQSIALVKAQLTIPAEEVLVTSHLQQPLVSNSRLGMGRVAISLINSTYGWQTSGLNSEYSHYWQHIMYSLARPQRQPYWLEPKLDQLQFVQQRYQSCVVANLSDKTLYHRVNKQKLPLLAVPTPLHSEQSCITTWLTSEGWQDLEIASDQNEGTPSGTSSIYAYRTTDWQAYQKSQNTQLSQQAIKNLTGGAVNQTTIKDLAKHWFWWCLVIACSVLWIERKIFS